MEGLSSDYDVDDLFKSIRDGLSYDGKLFAVPFYGESSFMMYRKDLFEDKGLKMPDQPTFDDVAKFAAALNDKKGGVTASPCAVSPVGTKTWPSSTAWPILRLHLV